MARKKKEAEWTPDSISAFIAAQERSMRDAGGLKVRLDGKQVKLNIQSTTEAMVSDIGLHLPHLCLRLLFQRTSFPLERTMVIYGPTGSNKSSLLYWFYHLVSQCNYGRYCHLEVESKDTPEFRMSFLNHDDNAGWTRECKSMDDFQTSIHVWLDWYKAMSARADGPGRRFPFVFGVDSLTAKMTLEAEKVMDKNEGKSTRRFADEARSLNDWFKYFPDKIQGWPVAFIAVNHDKKKQAAKTGFGPRPLGPPQSHSPGGEAPNYNTTYKLHLEKIGTLRQDASGWEGNRIRISIHKSSLSSGQLSLIADIAWMTQEVMSVSGTRTIRQTSVWNWYKATIEMLQAFTNYNSARATVVKDVLGLRKHSETKYSCARLGIKEANAVSPTELGRILESATDVLADIEPKLGIRPTIEWQPGVDFRDQQRAALLRVGEFMPAKGDTPDLETIPVGTLESDGEGSEDDDGEADDEE